MRGMVSKGLGCQDYFYGPLLTVYNTSYAAHTAQVDTIAMVVAVSR